VNLQVERGESTTFEVDIERMFLDYALHERLALQIGLFFTPIGYHNRKQYSRAWLTYSASVPALFEEELGFVPTHTTGLHAYGNLPVGPGALHYAASVGNGRGADPATNIYARDAAPKAYTAMLEYQHAGVREVVFGVAGWLDHIDTFRLDGPGATLDTLAPDAPAIRIRELGLNGHATIETEWFELLLEYAVVRHDVTRGDVLPVHRRSLLHGFFAEFAYHATPLLHPFLRYDRVALPADGGPYFPLRLGDDGLMTRHFAPDEHLVAAGVAWDRTTSNRLKAEYSLAFEGPRPLHSIIVQTAFGFQ
jgi:hypothetical protein